MIEIKLAIVAFFSTMFWWGGFNFLSARRDIAPPIFIIACGLFAHTWWATTMLPVIFIFHLGYGDRSSFRKVFGNGWGRGVWGLLAGISLSLGLFLTDHLSLGWFVLYLSGCFTFENALKDISQWLGDPIIAIGFSWLIFVIH